MVNYELMLNSKESEIESSQIYNTAKPYIILMVMKSLFECATLEEISEYGSENIEQGIMIPTEIKNNIRIESIQRFNSKMELLMNNTDFIIRKNREIFEQLRKELGMIKTIIPKTYKKITDQRNNTTKMFIKEREFSYCLEEMKRIRKELFYPLHSNQLIFAKTTEADIESIKRDIISMG